MTDRFFQIEELQSNSQELHIADLSAQLKILWTENLGPD